MDGGSWGAYWNSIELAAWTAVIGTAMVFTGAYLVEKSKGFHSGRAAMQLLCMIPMAVPGLVLGLAYVFFFNAPNNPLGFLYHTMPILVICTVTHFYTVSHLTAATALKQLDGEFESVSQSLKVPFYKTFFRIHCSKVTQSIRARRVTLLLVGKEVVGTNPAMTAGLRKGNLAFLEKLH